MTKRLCHVSHEFEGELDSNIWTREEDITVLCWCRVVRLGTFQDVKRPQNVAVSPPSYMYAEARSTRIGERREEPSSVTTLP